MPSNNYNFNTLTELVNHIRGNDKKYHLLYAFNGTGKTRLSMDFKQVGKQEDGADTLYFNAFTEDLFSWDNDLDNDDQRMLLLNKRSRFFNGIQELDMENKIRPLLRRYVDFNFLIDYDYVDADGRPYWMVNFIREVMVEGTPQNREYIKISRGEENIFIWCFFLAIAELALDSHEDYSWVKFIYIDDPISSLDDHNAIAVANHLANMVKNAAHPTIRTIMSSHHSLFFNVLCNEFKNANKYLLRKSSTNYSIKETNDTPFIYHVSLIQHIKKVIEEDALYNYHFNILRTILEKAANFHGFSGFSDCIHLENDDEENSLKTRMVNIMSHGGYSLFEPLAMVPENKEYFGQIFNAYLANYKFNEELFRQEILTPLP